MKLLYLYDLDRTMFIVLCFLSLFYSADLVAMKLVGGIAIGIVIYISFLKALSLFAFRKIKHKRCIYSWALLLLVYLALGITFGLNYRSIRVISAVLSNFLIFIYVSNSKWTMRDINFAFALSLIYISISLYFAILHREWVSYKFVMVNPNVLGAQIFLVSYFLFVKVLNTENKVKTSLCFLLIFSSSIVCFMSGSRSAMLAFFVSLCIYKLNKVNNVYIYALVAIFIFTFVFFYSQRVFMLTDNLMSWSAKNVFSGRETIWALLIANIRRNLLFGNGPGIAIQDIIYKNLSSHNLYLQILMQVGLFGFASFCVMVWHVTSKLASVDDRICEISLAFFYGILVHQTFEVSLIQNNFSLSVIGWLIVGIGLSRARITTVTNDKFTV